MPRVLVFCAGSDVHDLLVGSCARWFGWHRRFVKGKAEGQRHLAESSTSGSSGSDSKLASFSRFALQMP